MNDYYVTHVRRNNDGDIVALGNVDEKWIHEKEDVIKGITNGKACYHVIWQGKPVGITTVDHPDQLGDYLRTTADSTSRTALGSLPDWPLSTRTSPGGSKATLPDGSTDHRVTHVRRNHDGDIVALGNLSEKWLHEREDVIMNINHGSHSYYVSWNGTRVDIRQVHHPDQPDDYLRTFPDPTVKDNLEVLPDWPI